MKLKLLAQAVLVVATLAAVSLTALKRLTTERPEGLLLVSGRIEGDETSLASKVAGRVVKLHVDEGDSVEPNQLVAELDSDEFAAMLDYTKAEVVAAEKQLAQVEAKHAQAQERVKQAEIALKLARQTVEQQIKLRQASLDRAEAGIKAARAQLDNAQYELGRLAALSEKEVAATVELRRARDLTRQAEALHDAAVGQKAEAQAGLALANAQTREIELREAELSSARQMVIEAERGKEAAKAKIDSSMAAERAAKANLGQTKVYAPTAGVVLTRVVELGEVVDAGGVIYVVVDLKRLHLKGFVQELDLARVKVGQAAKVHVDALPDQTFEAKIKRINQQAEFTPKTIETPQQRVKLVFGIELAVTNVDNVLKPGLPADGVIRVNPEAPWAPPSRLR